MSIFLSTEGLSTKKLETTILENIKIASNLRKEIKKYDTYNPKDYNKEKSNTYIKNNDQIEKNDSNDEYNYYYEDIENISSSLSDEEIKSIIKESLPVKQNSNYYNIILNIKSKITKEIMEYYTLVDDTLSKEEIEDVKSAILFLQKKLLFIDTIDEENKIDSEQPVKNDIIFLTASNNKIYSMDDLSSIPQEYYSDLLELYNSIIDGTFKGVKRFNSNNKNVKGISEVRGFKIRIFFDKIDKNTYIILQVLIKKTDTDSIYFSSVSNRQSAYISQKQYIKDNVEQIKRQHVQIKDKFEKILKGKSKKKG